MAIKNCWECRLVSQLQLSMSRRFLMLEVKLAIKEHHFFAGSCEDGYQSIYSLQAPAKQSLRTMEEDRRAYNFKWGSSRLKSNEWLKIAVP
ncbi:hypothetical protein Tsubulata_024624, partial [Turnera subulata]